MIRKYGKDRKLEKDERVVTARKTVIIRSDGEKALIEEGIKYVVSGDYGDLFDEPKPKPKKNDEKEVK